MFVLISSRLVNMTELLLCENGLFSCKWRMKFSWLTISRFSASIRACIMIPVTRNNDIVGKEQTCQSWYVAMFGGMFPVGHLLSH